MFNEFEGKAMFNVYLDDIRCGPFNEMDGYPVWENWNNWIICRSVEQVKYLLLQDVVNNLSLDHDLGDNQPSGMDLVKWMVENDYFPTGEITIHSTNNVGATNMQSLLDNYFKHNPRKEK